jgi:hypothetical protein
MHFRAAVEPNDAGFLEKHMAVRRSDIDPPGVKHLPVPAKNSWHLAMPIQNFRDDTGIRSDVNRDGNCSFATGGQGFRYRANGSETTYRGADDYSG